MDLGIVTLIVAAVFTGAGIVLGFLISRLMSAKEQPQVDVSDLKGNVNAVISRVEDLVSRVNEKIDNLKLDQVRKLREEIDRLISEVNGLGELLRDIDVSESSVKALKEAEGLLKKLEFEVPEINQSLLTKINDNLIILRTDIENLRSKMKDKNRSVPSIDISVLNSVIDTINTALELTKKLNSSLVKSELTALAGSFKKEELNQLVKELDSQSLDSKELVVLLEEIRRKLEGVKNEASLRR